MSVIACRRLHQFKALCVSLRLKPNTGVHKFWAHSIRGLQETTPIQRWPWSQPGKRLHQFLANSPLSHKPYRKLYPFRIVCVGLGLEQSRKLHFFYYYWANSALGRKLHQLRVLQVGPGLKLRSRLHQFWANLAMHHELCRRLHQFKALGLTLVDVSSPAGNCTSSGALWARNVVWCGAGRGGVVWCGVVWHGVALRGVVSCRVVSRCVASRGVVWCAVLWCASHPILPCRSWELQASLDRRTWKILSNHINDETISHASPFGFWELHYENLPGLAQYFRYFRIILTGPNSFGTHELQIRSLPTPAAITPKAGSVGSASRCLSGAGAHSAATAAAAPNRPPTAW